MPRIAIIKSKKDVQVIDTTEFVIFYKDGSDIQVSGNASRNFLHDVERFDVVGQAQNHAKERA